MPISCFLIEPSLTTWTLNHTILLLHFSLHHYFLVFFSCCSFRFSHHGTELLTFSFPILFLFWFYIIICFFSIIFSWLKKFLIFICLSLSLGVELLSFLLKYFFTDFSMFDHCLFIERTTTPFRTFKYFYFLIWETIQTILIIYKLIII